MTYLFICLHLQPISYVLSDISAKGTVYVWGSNTDGQLGLLQSSINIYTDPTLLNIAHKIIRVDCGYYHTGFISGISG